MQYLGSKNKLSKELLEVFKDYLKEGHTYYEPFVGGANMIDKIKGHKRIGSDYNSFLIAMWKALQNGWQPPENISKEEYKQIRANISKFDKELVCFVGYLCSFGGKWFGGYASNSKGDNYCARGKRVLLKQIENLKDVKFIWSDYKDLELEPNSFIYCDPPYENTTKYKDEFDHKEFWQWVRDKTKDGHTILVSEYNAPNDFKCIWEKKVKTVLNKNNQNDFRLERLFKYTIK